MSYLSQFDVQKETVIKHKLWDSYAWHKAVWKLFPGQGDKSRDFLFRLDFFHTSSRLLLLSFSPPCLPEWGLGRTRKISPQFLTHDLYRFKIKANPTKRHPDSRKRVGLYCDKDLAAWIERKGAICGFIPAADELRIGSPTLEHFNRNGAGGKFVVVDFSGLLKVTDQKLFERAFLNGIGSAKAFGCGLLMLQPVK